MSFDYLTLPPVGTLGDDDHAEVDSFIQGLRFESTEGRSRYIQLAETSATIYAWGDSENTDGEHREIIVNEIQTAVLTQVDIQTKEPASVTLEPVETGEMPNAYYAGPPEMSGILGMAPEQMGDWTQPEDNAGQMQLPLMEQQVLMAEQLVMAGQLKEEWIVQVDDQCVADTYQKAFDVFEKRSQADLFNRQSALDANIKGWWFGLYEFDDDRKRHQLRHVSIKQVHIDPTVRDIAEAAYAGMDLVLDAAEAKKLYPDIAAQIDEKSHDGIPVRTDGYTTYDSNIESKQFRRKIVEMSIFWIRNQPCPMTPEHAMGTGAVQQVEMPVKQPAAPDGTMAHEVAEIPQVEGQEQANGNGLDDGEGSGREDTQGQGAEEQPTAPGRLLADNGSGDDSSRSRGANEANSGAGYGDIGEITEPPALLPPPTRPALIHAQTGEEIAPTLTDENGKAKAHPQWPTYPCIRQITLIAGMVVDDRECEHWDIPILHNVNIPFTNNPYGIGEPYRNRHAQRARNKMLTAMVSYAEHFARPASAMPITVAEALEEDYGSAYIDPGRTIKVPDDIWQLYQGKVNEFYSPPPMPQAVVDTQAILKTEITEQSGHSDVLQGRSQSDQSGRAIELLQTAASSLISFKASRLGDMVYRKAMLELHSLVWRLTPEDLHKIVKKYPLSVLRRICERAREIEWDVKVIVAQGNGTVMEHKAQQAAQDLQLNAISLETYQEKRNIDPQLERQRMTAQAQEMARAQMAAMPQQHPQAQPAANNQASNEEQN